MTFAFEHPVADPDLVAIFAEDADQDWRDLPDADESGHFSHTSPARPSEGHHHQRSEPDDNPGPDSSPAGPGPSEHDPDAWAGLLDGWQPVNRVRLIGLLLDRFAGDFGSNGALDAGARLFAWRVRGEHRT
jgi:hypothetical protein